MKKVLFIDRDGTLVIEPPSDQQLDSLVKLEFYPGVFKYLTKINEELDYELVIVTNQDGLGTTSFPTETFWPAQIKMLKAFENEGISFSEVLIDRSLPEDNAPTRKPETGLLHKYMYGLYNLDESFVIGDRITDIELAKNLGCKGILIGENKSNDAVLSTPYWEEIYLYLKNQNRTAKVSRVTLETEIYTELNLDGSGKSNIETGLNFLNHMLEQISKHGNIDLTLKVDGDLEVDEHHTIEDVALCLGEAFKSALGSKTGVERYGFLLPMDESLAQVAIDFGGRPYLVWNASFSREKIGDVPTEMFEHFFKSFSDAAQCNLNIEVSGKNEHHKIESVFKAFAKAIKMAVSKSSNSSIPSTKGVL